MSAATSDPVPLEPYLIRVEKSMLTQRDLMRDTIFMKRSPGGPTPLLRKDCENRILVYTGCFNPPHRSHRDLLCQAFFCGDRNIIAAVILPVSNLDDDGKRFNHGIFPLSLYDRAALWQNDALMQWCWIFPDRRGKFDDFKEMLKTLVNLDGYKVRFVGLVGTDHISVEEGIDGTWYGDGCIITSDISRLAQTLLDSSGRPCDLEGCGPWVQLEISNIIKGLRAQFASSGYEWTGKDDFLDPYRKMVHATDIKPRAIVWQCLRKDRGHRGGYVRFIRGPQCPPFETSSSTTIRRVFNSSTELEVIFDQIKYHALNPSLLLTMAFPNPHAPVMDINSWESNVAVGSDVGLIERRHTVCAADSTRWTRSCTIFVRRKSLEVTYDKGWGDENTLTVYQNNFEIDYSKPWFE